MRNRVFHQARIAGMPFDGIIAGGGPYLSCRMNGGVALEVCSLRYLQPETWMSRRIPPLGWWVVKYHNEDGDMSAAIELRHRFRRHHRQRQGA
jgi:hypothetical protein